MSEVNYEHYTNVSDPLFFNFFFFFVHLSEYVKAEDYKGLQSEPGGGGGKSAVLPVPFHN